MIQLWNSLCPEQATLFTFSRTSRTRRARENEPHTRSVCLRNKQVRAEQGLRAALPAAGCTSYMSTPKQLPSVPGLLETTTSGRGQRDISAFSPLPSALQQAHLCWLDSSGSQVGRKHITDMDKSFLTSRAVLPGTLHPSVC